MITVSMEAGFRTFQLDAAESPVEGLPAIALNAKTATIPTSVPTAIPTLAPTPSPTVLVQDFSPESTGRTSDNPAMPIVWGSIPVGLFVVTMLIFWH